MSNPNSSDVSARSAFFDKQADIWSQTHYGPKGGMLPRVERFEQALKLFVSEDAEILDYGCGTGEIAAVMAERGYRVEACDMSAKMIEQARCLHAKSDVQFTWLDPNGVGADIGLPFGGKKFDAIVCSSVLEYVHDLPRNLNILANALKSGGWLFATVPDINHPARRNEGWHRSLMSVPIFRSVISRMPFSAAFELQWLSHNRFSPAEWVAHFHAAQLRPVWRDGQDHPLILFAGRRDTRA